MADRVYSVFVSSTYEDLREERLAVTDVLLRSSCLPAGMELFSASARPPWETITRALDLADYMVLILAGRYGSPLGDTKKSYTENEYEYALAHEIPVLAFVHGDLQALPYGKIETAKQRQVKAFHKRVLAGEHTADFWVDLAGLKEKVALAIPAAIRDTPRPGWVRGDVAEVAAAAATPVMNVEVKRVDDESLCPLRSNDEDFERLIQENVQDALAKLPPETGKRDAGVPASSILGQGMLNFIRESEALTRSVMAPENRTRQQYIEEVEDYGRRLGEGLQVARRKLAGQMLAPLRLGLRNRKQMNLFNAQLRLRIDGEVEVALPPDGFEEWSPVDELPAPPRAWGPSPRVGPTVQGWPSPDLTGIYPEVEVTYQGAQTVLTYPAVDVRPGDFEALDPVVLLIPDTVERLWRATWTLAATNIDDIVEGDLEIEIPGAPRDVWREWASSHRDAVP